jgi:hypothetical protein
MITPEELDIIDMPKTSLKVKHPKTGVEGYRVGLEVFHQLHCINLLRRATYKEYYTELGTDGDFAEGDDMLRIHLGSSTINPTPLPRKLETDYSGYRSLPRDFEDEHTMQRRHRPLYILSSPR